MKNECTCGLSFEGNNITDIETAFEVHLNERIEGYVDGTLFLHRNFNNPVVSAGLGLYPDAVTSVKGFHRLLKI